MRAGAGSGEVVGVAVSCEGATGADAEEAGAREKEVLRWAGGGASLVGLDGELASMKSSVMATTGGFVSWPEETWATAK